MRIRRQEPALRGGPLRFFRSLLPLFLCLVQLNLGVTVLGMLAGPRSARASTDFAEGRL